MRLSALPAVSYSPGFPRLHPFSTTDRGSIQHRWGQTQHSGPRTAAAFRTADSGIIRHCASCQRSEPWTATKKHQAHIQMQAQLRLVAHCHKQARYKMKVPVSLGRTYNCWSLCFGSVPHKWSFCDQPRPKQCFPSTPSSHCTTAECV